MILKKYLYKNPITTLSIFFIIIILLNSCKDEIPKKIGKLISPNKQIELQLFSGKGQQKIEYRLLWNDTIIVNNSPFALDIEGDVFENLTIKDIQQFERDTVLSPVIASKRKNFRDHYNTMVVNFNQPISLEIRIYDEGLAFRWIGKYKNEIKIINETFEVNPTGDIKLYYAPYKEESPKGFVNFLINLRERIKNLFSFYNPYESYFETQYRTGNLSECEENSFFFAPVLLGCQNGKYIVIGESDVIDYPGMILQKSSQNGIKSRFSPSPLKEEMPKDSTNYLKLRSVTKFADYISATNGERTFPWRVVMLTDDPSNIPSSDLVLKLASPSKINGDLSWIKPGQITDEWLVNMNLYDVPFKAGKNTSSYKYYIDFAEKFGIEYIMVDEGWYLDGNLKKLNKNVNLDSIVSYAREKNIGIGLWFNASVLEQNLEETLAKHSAMGVKIILIDFINRNDQKAMNFYAKIAEACARYKLMLNIHSAPAPAGFEITYPNAVSREGVMGSEWNGWSNLVTVSHNLMIPFTRMFSGSLDYEPGLLDNSTENGFRNIEGNPMSQGTRAHQLAMYVVYDNPLQYFVGNPSQGLKEPEFMKFLGNIPTTWDETIVLKSSPAEYIVTARSKNGVWYIGAMNNWTEHELSVDISRLGFKQYSVTGIIDGINSNNYASDYKIILKQKTTEQIINLKLAKGGGSVLRIEPLK